MQLLLSGLPRCGKTPTLTFVSARQLGRTGREGIELDLTNEQLALTAHMSLFTATRKLSKWRDLGILEKYRGKTVLRSQSLFERIANDTWQ